MSITLLSLFTGKDNHEYPSVISPNRKRIHLNVTQRPTDVLYGHLPLGIYTGWKVPSSLMI